MLTSLFMYSFVMQLQSEHDAVTLAEADKLRDMGCFVFTVGLGSWLRIANVRQIATIPSYYGHILDWKDGLFQRGYITTATAGMFEPTR